MSFKVTVNVMKFAFQNVKKLENVKMNEMEKIIP